jgi:uncharacterized membrane protein YbhN (UPF0104 family)
MTSAAFTRTVLIAVGKAAITAVAIVIIVSQIKFSFLLAHLHKLSALTAAASLILLFVQTALLAGLRLKLVLEVLGRNRRLAETSQIALSGLFFEQVAFGFVGGDAMRLWLLNRTDVPLRTALQAIVIDRCLGLVGLFLLALVGLPGLVVLLTGYDLKFVAFSGAVGGCLIGVLAALAVLYHAKRMRTPFLAELVAVAVAAIGTPDVRKRLLWAFGLAVVVQTMNVFVFFLLGRDLALGLDLGHWFLTVPPVLLISMLPISAGGWGLREASFVVALASFGVGPEEAIIPPILFGLGVLVATLPGGVIWLVNRKRKVRVLNAGVVAGEQASSGGATDDDRRLLLARSRPSASTGTSTVES